MSNQLGLFIVQELLRHCEAEDQPLNRPGALQENSVRLCYGKIGTMKTSDIYGSVITAARREKMINNGYRQEHSLYNVISNALQGVLRGDKNLDSSLRTASLRFVLARGEYVESERGIWLAVAMYGNIGSTIIGHEHEVFGFGMGPLA